MDSEEFLDRLLLQLKDDNTEINTFGFKKLDDNYLKLIDDSLSCHKRIFTMSLRCFHENLDILAEAKHFANLDAIISLPIYNDDDNLIILIFDYQKSASECLFIDESDSLLHRGGSVDWTYASEELIGKITKTYDEFAPGDTSVMLDLDEVMPSVRDDMDVLTFKSETSQANDNEIDEVLSLKSHIVEDSAKKSRVIFDEVADGLLELKSKASDSEITKHDSRLDEKHHDTGLAFLNDAMYYKKRQNPENLLIKDGKPLIEGNVELRRLGKIADLHNIYVKNDLNSILIATCKGCNSKIVYYNKDISDFKGEVFIELINPSDIVLMDYLYEYLNSSNGLNDLLYYSKGGSHITPRDIKNMKIPVPPLDVQKEIVDVARQSREFFKRIELLKKQFSSNILDYKPMKKSLDEFNGNIEFDSTSNEITHLSRSWRHAYKGLIWPLAISYLSATKGGFEIVEKKDNYLVLFEFIAAFNTIVLLSGLPEDVYQNNFSRIWNSKNPNEYKQMTFANWVIVSKNLAEVYKSNNFESKLDEELFDKIADDMILNILNDAKNLRNDESHGSHSNAYEAKQVIEKLEVYLEDIFDILEVYSDYQLIYVTGNFESSAKQGYDHRVILLNGPCAQPIYENIIFDTVLNKESLYLYNPKNNKKLLLKDRLIKFSPLDENKKNWALFLYYSTDRKEFNAFYKCFQSNEEDIKVGISSLEHDILGKSFLR